MLSTRSKKGLTMAMAGIAVSLVIAAYWTKGTEILGVTQPPVTDVSRPKAEVSGQPDYIDGAYEATGVYGNLPSSITVNVQLKDNMITRVIVTPHAANPTSLDLQRRFADAVPAVVVGKSIDQVNVGRLAGSSGTPKGFNDAIRKIREQAGQKD